MQTGITRKVIHLQLVSQTKIDWSRIANGIIKGCNTSYDKSKAIFLWIAENIAYDTTLKIYDADTAYMKKKGVCQAYCEIFYQLGIASGLDVRIIKGKNKASDGKVSNIGHVWIAVNISNITNSKDLYPKEVIYYEGQEKLVNFASTRGLQRSQTILVEPTWGAGSIIDNKFVKRNNPMVWFNVKPEWMIFTHYPDNKKDQLLENNHITISQFYKLPPLGPEFEPFGFNPLKTLITCIKSGNITIPYINCKYSDYIIFEDIPFSCTLSRNKTYTFSFRKRKKCDIVIFNGDNDNNCNINSNWKEEGNIVTNIIKVTANDDLSVGLNTDNSNNYNIFLSYKVI